MERTFVLKRNTLGFGWEVVDTREQKSKVVLHTSNKEQAKSMYKLMVETENLDLLPKPYTQWVPRLLVVRAKYGTHYYMLKNADYTRKIMMKHLSKVLNDNGIYEYDVPEVTITDEFINAAPKGDEKDKLLSKRKIEIVAQKQIQTHNYYVDALKAALKAKHDDKAYALFLHFIGEEFDIEDFENYPRN